jgi:hypothetical protein
MQWVLENRAMTLESLCRDPSNNIILCIPDAQSNAHSRQCACVKNMLLMIHQAWIATSTPKVIINATQGMARTNGYPSTDSHGRLQIYRSRRDILEALISGTATAEDWRHLPENITTALKSGCIVELEPNGEFFIHDNAQDEQDLIQEYQDVEMIDAPPLSPGDRTHACTSRHLRTRGICPIDEPRTPGTSECLKIRHRAQHMPRTDPRRFRAFHAIMERTKSAFGNGSSPLARECAGEHEINRRARVGRIVLDSWKVAPVLKTFQDAKIQALSCERDVITGTPVLIYLEHNAE